MKTEKFRLSNINRQLKKYGRPEKV